MRGLGLPGHDVATTEKGHTARSRAGQAGKGPRKVDTDVEPTLMPRYRDWPPVRMKNNRLKYLRPPDPLVCVVLLRLTSERTLFPVAKCHVGLAVVTPWSQDRYASNCRLNGRLCRTPQRTRVSARRRVPVTRFRPIAVDKRPRSNLKP